MQQAPMCMNCKHFRFDNKFDNVCEAYPVGIPTEILTNKVDHRKPYKDDNGIQFVAINPRIRLPASIEPRD